jgi:uncharacterized protein (TIRG00374 family)
MGNRARDSQRRPPWWSLAAVAAVGIGLYVGLPRLAGLDDTWGRVTAGDPWWLAAAALLEIASYAAYVFTFHRLFATPGSPIGWRESYDISMAGVAATRLLATAGAGGIALTAWALARAGMARGELLRRLTTFFVLLYGIFMITLVVVGTGLRTGVLSGPAPFGLTVVPALFGGVVIVAALLIATVPRDLGRRVDPDGARHERVARLLAHAASATAGIASGVRGALALLRAHDPALLGALGWWAFDIGVVWACFHAFGETPPGGVIVMAYFAGQLGNVLPLPGGLGGVEGGMIGALLAFGVEGGLAVAVVLSYRAFAYWLPIVPGALAYMRLLRTVRDWDRALLRARTPPR